MNAPVVVVTRDVSRDPLRIDWYEDEGAYYTQDPLAELEFDPAKDVWVARKGRNARPDTSLAAARLLLDLVLDPQASVYHLATHFVPEAGAPLEPIPAGAVDSTGCTRDLTCRADRHHPDCYALYRTEREVADGVFPDPDELVRRRRNQQFHNWYVRQVPALDGGPDAA